MLEQWVLLTSAFTGAAAVVTTVRHVFRRVRAGRTRRRIHELLRRIRRIELRLSALAAELDNRLGRGVTWAGLDIWPIELRGHLVYVRALLEEAERSEAMLRALDASGADERLRADVERLYVIFRQVGREYIDGSMKTYRQHFGEPIEMSAGGREVTLTLADESASAINDLRDEFTTLMRTCLYRLEADEHAEEYGVYWPIQRFEVERVAELDVWATEPPPLDHSGLDLVTEYGEGSD